MKNFCDVILMKYFRWRNLMSRWHYQSNITFDIIEVLLSHN